MRCHRIGGNANGGGDGGGGEEGGKGGNGREIGDEGGRGGETGGEGSTSSGGTSTCTEPYVLTVKPFQNRRPKTNTRKASLRPPNGNTKTKRIKSNNPELDEPDPVQTDEVISAERQAQIAKELQDAQNLTLIDRGPDL